MPTALCDAGPKGLQLLWLCRHDGPARGCVAQARALHGGLRRRHTGIRCSHTPMMRRIGHCAQVIVRQKCPMLRRGARRSASTTCAAASCPSSCAPSCSGFARCDVSRARPPRTPPVWHTTPHPTPHHVVCKVHRLERLPASTCLALTRSLLARVPSAPPSVGRHHREHAPHLPKHAEEPSSCYGRA